MKDEIRLYHKNVAWKSYFNRASGRLIYNKDVDFSKHLCEQCLFGNDKHNISLIKLGHIISNIQEDKQRYWIYEVETIYNAEHHTEQITKVAIRTYYDDTYDVIIVFSETKIKTAWLNERTDKHGTLNKRNYYNFNKK